MEVIKFEKKKMIPLTDEGVLIIYKKLSYICKNKLKTNMLMMKNTVELEIIVITQVNTVVLHIVYVI